jgi:segregation and condensation protein B
MQEIKNRIETVLFTTGRFMAIEEIAGLCGVGSVGIVKDALNQLKEDYEKRECALCLFEENGKWKLNIKKNYNYLTTKLIAECELERPVQETLAVIAYKTPVLQSEVIKIRGNGGYEHIKFLRENSFITSEKKGRTRLLKLAPKFFDYFDIIEDQIKSKFSDSIDDLESKEIVDVTDEKSN